MPIFSYICRGCGCRFEDLVFTPEEEAAVECPECSDKNIEKGFGTFSVGRSQRVSGACPQGAPSPSCASCCSTGGCGAG